MVAVERAVKIDGRAKSNRPWKTKQTDRFSAIQRKGVLSHLSTSFEAKQELRAQRDNTKALENQLKEAKKQRIAAAKALREEKEKRRVANEYKSSSYQLLNASKIKTMSKKQLRMVKKTSVNNKGQVELVNPWASKTKSSTTKPKRKQ